MKLKNAVWGSIILSVVIFYPSIIFSQNLGYRIIQIKGERFAINKGSIDGLKLNSYYRILHSNRTIGRAKTIAIRANISALQIIENSEPVQIGDIVIVDQYKESNDILSYNPSKYKTNKNIGRYGWATVAAITLIGSSAMGDKMFATTVIPVVGPFKTIMRIEQDPNGEYLPGGKDLLYTSGILQASFFSWF